LRWKAAALEDDRPTIIGTLDAKWRVHRISVDVTDVLGFSSTECVGVFILDAVHPKDAPTVLSHMTSLTQDARTVALHLRVRRQPRHWQISRVVLCSLAASRAYPFAFALTPLEHMPSQNNADRRRRELEIRLRRIAAEVRASGIALFPFAPTDPKDLDALAALSPRQREVLERLIAGQRAPSIARDLFLSQNTVRNHLSAIFRRFGVHTQSQLLERLKSFGDIAELGGEQESPIEQRLEQRPPTVSGMSTNS
jgi:DNA-binding CsgD family transcriptional regulator